MRRARALSPMALCFVALVAPAGPALAWGRLGHRAAARIADARLTPAARAAVRDLLEPGESLADASTWADEIRGKRPRSAGWHFVNVPIAQTRYDPSYCAEGGCVVSRVVYFRNVLLDPDATRTQRQEALRFLVHLIQDLHQPLHVADRGDKGGNQLQVQYLRRQSNLHRVWDSDLLTTRRDDEVALSRDLEALATPGAAVAWAGGTLYDWADESIALARRAYRQPDGAEIRAGDRLGTDYVETHRPEAHLRLAQAGTRVASVLNGIFR